MNIHVLLADLVVLLHVGFVLFAVCGGLLALWNRYCIWLHLPAVAWAAYIEFAGGICPLTPLEVWLRQQGGTHAYSTGFIEHYIIPLLYPTELTRTLQLTLGAAVIIVNIVIYAVVVARIRRGS